MDDGSLYSQVRLSLMLAVKSKRSSWSWTGTLSCCVLSRCNSHPLTTATLSTQKKIQQYHLQLLWSSLWSDISISNRSTPPICSLYSFTMAGDNTPTYFLCSLSHLFIVDIWWIATWVDASSCTAELTIQRTTAIAYQSFCRDGGRMTHDCFFICFSDCKS